MSAFAEKIKTSQSDLVYLARLKEQSSGMDAWYYVQIKSKVVLPVFLKKIKTGINLAEYGDVIYSGWGQEPPEGIKQKIKDQYA